ncbi:MAG: hypothetical protein MZV65_54095 [Chromatiales bacterium]|nr:hypothetical protein [Chromatiales bacterium]
MVLPDGEQYKTLGHAEPRSSTRCWRARCDRKTHCVVALGGGVVGDMAGFAAAMLPARRADSSRCRPRCSRRSTPRSAARPASTTRSART